MSDTNKILTKRQKKLLFSTTELSDAFSIAGATIRKRLAGIQPVTKVSGSYAYNISDVTDLVDTREPYVPPQKGGEYGTGGGGENQFSGKGTADIERDPNKMKPGDRRLHYQAEDLKQASELKRRKNDVESGKLIPSEEVEKALAQAFKTVALTLDTLPDALERDGVIDSNGVQHIIAIIDSSREQLANDLSGLSPATEAINESGDW